MRPGASRVVSSGRIERRGDGRDSDGIDGDAHGRVHEQHELVCVALEPVTLLHEVDAEEQDLDLEARGIDCELHGIAFERHGIDRVECRIMSEAHGDDFEARGVAVEPRSRVRVDEYRSREAQRRLRLAHDRSPDAEKRGRVPRDRSIVPLTLRIDLLRLVIVPVRLSSEVVTLVAASATLGNGSATQPIERTKHGSMYFRWGQLLKVGANVVCTCMPGAHGCLQMQQISCAGNAFGPVCINGQCGCNSTADCPDSSYCCGGPVASFCAASGTQAEGSNSALYTCNNGTWQ